MIPVDIAFTPGANVKGAPVEFPIAAGELPPDWADAFGEVLEAIPPDAKSPRVPTEAATMQSVRVPVADSAPTGRRAAAERHAPTERHAPAEPSAPAELHAPAAHETPTRRPARSEDSITSAQPPDTVLERIAAISLEAPVVAAVPHSAPVASHGAPVDPARPERRPRHASAAERNGDTDAAAAIAAAAPQIPGAFVARLATLVFGKETLSAEQPAVATMPDNPRNDGDAPATRDAGGARRRIAEAGPQPAAMATANAADPNVVETADVRVTVMSRATHFAPTLPLRALDTAARGAERSIASTNGDSSTGETIGPVAVAARETPTAVPASLRSEATSIKSGARNLPAEQHADVPVGAVDAVEPTETSEPAVPEARPAGQLDRIATAILDDLSRSRPADPAAPSAPASRVTPVVAQSYQPPARTLTVQLHPADLGVVHVEMHLRGGALSLKIRAEREDVARALESDRQALADVLRSAGQDIEQITIQPLSKDALPLQADAQGTGPRASQTGADGGRYAEGDGRSQRQADSGRGHSQGGYSQQGHESHAQSPDPGSDRRDLYV